MTLAHVKTRNEDFAGSVPDVLKERLKFAEVDGETQKALKEYLPYLEKALPSILAEFYEHIRKWPNLTSMFKDETRMDYARQAQQSHWLHLFEAQFDEAYTNSVRKIGLIHSRIGLEPTWYIGAYAFTLNRLYAHASKQYQSFFSPQEAQKKTANLFRALNQCVMIDMDMAISIYLEENKNTYESKLNTLADNFETTIGAIVNSVSSASTELEASAENLAHMAGQTSAGAESVAVASEESSSNVAAVSSATEELSSSISHVSDMARKSHQSAEQAANEADISVETMHKLKEAIDKVSEVANLISDIASQTNLLALNATIEAARAGEAGKGFAVVASEVKSLANGTTSATEDIKAQVTEMISKSNSVAHSLQSVKKVIDDSKSVSHETAQSIEEQKKAVNEIAVNIEQVSAGTNDISKNIGNISESSQGVSDAARGILDAAKDLSRQGTSLRDAVSQFIVDIKAGG